MKFLGIELDVLKLAIRNTANTFKSSFVSLTTADRVVTFPDRSFTVAGMDDISPKNVSIANQGINGLFLNGSCQDLTNNGYSALVFEALDFPFGARGSFKQTGYSGFRISDNFMPVNPDGIIRVSLSVKKLINPDNSLLYAGLMQYDIDNNQIFSNNVSRVAGSDTTLAAPLNVGDTTITLTSSASWLGNDPFEYKRSLSIFAYRDSTGFFYDRDKNPYTRYVVRNAWAQGGISGNVITLSSPWSLQNPTGGAWPIGTKVSNSIQSTDISYFINGLYPSTTEWENYSFYISGIDKTGLLDKNKFFPGCSKIKFGLLPNYVSSNDVTAFANIEFEKVPLSKLYDEKLITVSSNYTVLPTDDTINVNASGVTLTLPSASGLNGKEITIRNGSASTITINSPGSTVLPASNVKRYMSDGTSWYAMGSGAI